MVARSILVRTPEDLESLEPEGDSSFALLVHAPPEFEERLSHAVAEIQPRLDLIDSWRDADREDVHRALDQLHELDFELMAISTAGEHADADHVHCVIIPRGTCFQAADHPTQDPLHTFNPACKEAVRSLLQVLRGSGYIGVFPVPWAGEPLPPLYPHKAPWCPACRTNPTPSVVAQHEGLVGVGPVPDVVRDAGYNPPGGLPPPEWERLRIMIESLTYPLLRERGGIPPLVAGIDRAGKCRIVVVDSDQSGDASFDGLLREVAREISLRDLKLAVLGTSGTGLDPTAGTSERLMMLHIETEDGTAFALATTLTSDPEGPGYVIGGTTRQEMPLMFYPMARTV